MSFVDLMKDDVWTEADITRRTEALVRSEFSVDQETILNRKLQGALSGQYQLSTSDQQDLARFSQVTLAAQQAGTEARASVALLNEAMEIEALWLSGETLPEMTEALSVLIEARGRCVGEPPAAPTEEPVVEEQTNEGEGE